MLMNGKHNNNLSSQIVINELENYKDVENVYTMILKYKFQKIPNTTFDIWNHYLIKNISSIDEIRLFLIKPLIEEVVKPATLAISSIPPPTAEKTKPSAKIIKAKRPRLSKSKKDDLDLRKLTNTFWDKGIPKIRSGVEKIEYLDNLMKIYQEKEKNGVTFTPNALKWIRMVLLKNVACFKDHCGGDPGKFVEKNGQNWSAYDFKCGCNDDLGLTPKKKSPTLRSLEPTVSHYGDTQPSDFLQKIPISSLNQLPNVPTMPDENLVEQEVLDDLESRYLCYYVQDNGIWRSRTGTERIEYLKVIMKEYQEKVAAGVNFTRKAKNWINQTLVRSLDCLKDHCDGNPNIFVQQNGDHWLGGKFKCQCIVD